MKFIAIPSSKINIRVTIAWRILLDILNIGLRVVIHF